MSRSIISRFLKEFLYSLKVFRYIPKRCNTDDIIEIGKNYAYEFSIVFTIR